MSISLKRAGLAVVGAGVLALTAIFGPHAFADPATPTPTPVPVVPVVPANPPLACPPGSDGLCVVGPIGLKVKTDNGVLAGVRVGNILCVRAEALSTNTTANAKVMIPCPVHYVPIFKDCDEARAAGAHDIPLSSPLYRKKLDNDRDGIACETEAPVSNTDVPTAPTPQIVTSHLPVTH
jgi:hypothetical protein